MPLLIALDQENGGVNSLYDEIYIRQFPSAMGMAATGSKQLAKYIARATAQELGACGVNWILGPVMDVLTNARSQPLGVRSFGDDPQEVSSYSVECMKGYQEGGLATCGKHFPSYGNLEFFGAPNDVPTITDSFENMSQTALVPFRNAIAQGLDAMMVGGVAMSSSNVNVMHACLSEQVVRDLLRNEMHFDGVVVSECLEMEALSRNIGISGGTVMAFNAGCDLILTCRSLSVQEEAINGLRAGLDNGMIERFRVQESVQRVLSLKSRYTSWDKAFAPLGVDQLTQLQPLHTNLSTNAYNKSITVVRDRKHLLPLGRILGEQDELLLLTPLVKPLPASAASKIINENPMTLDLTRTTSNGIDTSVMNGERVFGEMGKSLARQRNGRVLHTSYTAHGLRPVHEMLMARAKAVIIVTADAGRNMYQNGFTKHVATLCKVFTGTDGQVQEKPCIVIAVSSPFDFVADQTVGTYICTYDFTETALQALVKVLYGDLTPSGVLPGSFGHVPKPHQSRQQWLVEGFNEERDLLALDNLLRVVHSDDIEASESSLGNATSASFLLRDLDIEESHFVVRNSTTKELFGFCATYYNKRHRSGYIAAIIVDPGRRKLSIGHSLHDRAIRALLQKKGVTRFVLGSRFPYIFSGIPKQNDAEYVRLRQWFAKLGWNMSQSRTIQTMAIQDLVGWTPPEGLAQALKNPAIKYDLVHGMEYADVITQHVRQTTSQDALAVYRLAMSNKEGCAIIRAKNSSDGGMLGSVILYRGISKLASFLPAAHSLQQPHGGLTCLAFSKEATDHSALLQGLVLLGTRQLKKQGIKTVLVDYVSEPLDHAMAH